MSSSCASALQKKARRRTAEENNNSITGATSTEVAAAMEQLRQDKKTPDFMKTLINHMLSVQEKLSSVLLINQQLNSQVANLREENNTLRRALAEAESRHSSSAHVVDRLNVSDSVEEKERLRSIVIAGIAESDAVHSVDRVYHDYEIVENILDHLDIECIPQSVYRLGRPDERKRRLIKVVLPSTFHQKLTLKRATRLSSSPYRGAFIRPSLTKTELERNRVVRSTTRSSDNVNNQVPQSTQLTIASQSTQLTQSTVNN